jgi:hypothetical protein
VSALRRGSERRCASGMICNFGLVELFKMFKKGTGNSLVVSKLDSLKIGENAVMPLLLTDAAEVSGCR